MKRIPLLTIALSILAVAIHASPAATSWMEFSRSALERGATWRLATGHLTHYTADHLRWDVVAFLILGAVVENLSRRGWVITLGLASIVIGAGVWAWQPQFATYRGLSGIDSAFFGFITGRLFSEGRRMSHHLSAALGIVGAAGFIAKCVYEHQEQATLFVASDGFAPVPLAHALGAATGLLVGLVLKADRIRREPPDATYQKDERRYSSPSQAMGVTKL